MTFDILRFLVRYSTVQTALSGGTHTLEIARRADGSKLDAIAVLH